MDNLSLTPSEAVAQTVIAYYRRLDQALLTEHELTTWLRGLSAGDQAELLAIGLDKAVLLPACRRYVLESRGFSMLAFRQAHLQPHELAYWVDDNDGGVRPT
jgi:hypothetical protein